MSVLRSLVGGRDVSRFALRRCKCIRPEGARREEEERKRVRGERNAAPVWVVPEFFFHSRNESHCANKAAGDEIFAKISLCHRQCFLLTAKVLLFLPK